MKLRPHSPPVRVLLGPGPSECAPEVQAALARPTLGHLDPEFLRLMDEIRAALRTVLGTSSELTFPVPGTGSSGMEAVLVNLLEPGDAALIGVNGYFGERLCEIARRCGAEVTRVEGQWGRALAPDDVRRAAGGRGYRLVALVHGETSTGVHTALEGMRAVADELGALLVADCVTTLGGMPLAMDALGLDALYSGTQKCLAAPCGLAPVSLSARALERLAARQRPVQSWYLDLSLVRSYWGQERVYHHTAPIQNLYGLHEALRLVLDEGLEARWARHERHGRALWTGLGAMGLTLPVPESERLIPLTAVSVPEGVDDARARRFLLEHYSIEIGGGLGAFKGRVWRIGLMGVGARRSSVELVLCALRAALADQGRKTDDPLPAVHAVYSDAERATLAPAR